MPANETESVSCVRRSFISHLFLVDALGHGPGGDDVVHDPLGEGLGHLVQLHELPDRVEDVVIARRGRGHLLDDCRDVAEDGGVEQRCGANPKSVDAVSFPVCRNKRIVARALTSELANDLLPATIIMQMEKIFSLSVSAATLPKPTEVMHVMV